MIPMELKVDKEGLLYTEDKKLLQRKMLLIDNRSFENERYYQNGFYPMLSTDEYIIKYAFTALTKKEREAYKKMLSELVEKQDKIPNVDFPIGYFRERRKLEGLIIRYYKDGVSCDQVFNTQDIEALGKFYYHDEDSIRNIFLLLEDVLNRVYEMFENGIYYSDLNPGNIILTDNKAKIIDFDPRFVKFDNKDKRLEIILATYSWLIRETMKFINFYYYIDASVKSFEDMKNYTKKLENKIRSR